MSSTPPYTVTPLDYSATGYFTKLITDYLKGDEWLKQFYVHEPTMLSVEEAILTKRNQKLYRNELAEALLKQYDDLLKEEDAALKNILSLKNENTFTVVTAHQPNLFLGPLYLIYKITSAIKMAELLNEKYPAEKFIPVYWMGSEDHDVDELNHILLFGKKIEWNLKQKGSFGNYNTESLGGLIDGLKEVAGNSPYTDELIQLLKASYLESKTITEATRKLLHHFFGKQGLLIVDGNDSALKKIFAPVMKGELLNSNAERLVNATIVKLEEKYPVQVKPRNINLFYLKENLRERIVREGAEYKVLNTEITFSEQAILSELENHPERFSPNVVLRPLYQEMILPNIAFIGGGAEVSYFMEFKNSFEHYKIAFPILFLRNCALVIDKSSATRMNKFGLTETSLFADIEEIIKSFTLQQTGDSFEMNEERIELEKLFQQLKSKISALDKTLENQIAAEQTRVLKFIQSLEERLLKTEKKKHEDSIQQIRKLKEKLFPDNSLQERHESFIAFYLSHGVEFFNIIHEAFNPFEKKFIVISLQ